MAETQVAKFAIVSGVRRPQRRRLVCRVMALAIATTTVACGSDGEGPSSSTSASPDASVATTPGPDDPQITVVSPKNDGKLKPGPITVVVKVKNFDLVPRLGEKAAPGEGHIAYYLGVEYPIPISPDRSALKPFANKDEVVVKASDSTTFTWDDPPKGDRVELAVQLVNNDHTPLRPPAWAYVILTA